MADQSSLCKGSLLATDNDPEIVVRLPLSALHTVVQHLYLGLYVGNPVHDLVRAIVEQANPQIAALTNLVASPATGTGDEAIPSPDRLN